MEKCTAKNPTERGTKSVGQFFIALTIVVLGLTSKHLKSRFLHLLLPWLNILHIMGNVCT